jgi:hypothetical protein
MWLKMTRICGNICKYAEIIPASAMHCLMLNHYWAHELKFRVRGNVYRLLQQLSIVRRVLRAGIRRRRSRRMRRRRSRRSMRRRRTWRRKRSRRRRKKMMEEGE